MTNTLRRIVYTLLGGSMTQEKKYHEAMVTVSCSIGNWCSEDIQKYVTSLEQRIQELESPKTCEGCRWDGTRSNARARYCDELLAFVPKEFYCARYEPKKDTE